MLNIGADNRSTPNVDSLGGAKQAGDVGSVGGAKQAVLLNLWVVLNRQYC